MKAAEALLISRKKEDELVDREMVKILDEIRIAASIGRFSCRFDYLSSMSEKKLKDLGYKVKSGASGERESAVCYYSVSWDE
jgi:hypothetical protein